MKARGTPVKFIRCDNAGENRDLKTKVEQSNDLNDITFEFTARDNPQPNGKIEKRFDIIFNRVLCVLMYVDLKVIFTVVIPYFYVLKVMCYMLKPFGSRPHQQC